MKKVILVILLIIYFFFIPVYYHHMKDSWINRGNKWSKGEERKMMATAVLWPIFFPIECVVVFNEGWKVVHGGE
jgi:hypothetical protein